MTSFVLKMGFSRHARLAALAALVAALALGAASFASARLSEERPPPPPRPAPLDCDAFRELQASVASGETAAREVVVRIPPTASAPPSCDGLIGEGFQVRGYSELLVRVEPGSFEIRQTCLGCSISDIGAGIPGLGWWLLLLVGVVAGPALSLLAALLWLARWPVSGRVPSRSDPEGGPASDPILEESGRERPLRAGLLAPRDGRWEVTEEASLPKIVLGEGAGAFRGALGARPLLHGPARLNGLRIPRGEAVPLAGGDVIEARGAGPATLRWDEPRPVRLRLAEPGTYLIGGHLEVPRLALVPAGVGIIVAALALFGSAAFHFVGLLPAWLLPLTATRLVTKTPYHFDIETRTLSGLPGGPRRVALELEESGAELVLRARFDSGTEVLERLKAAPKDPFGRLLVEELRVIVERARESN